MLDVVFIAATVVFFAIAAAYVWACDRLVAGGVPMSVDDVAGLTVAVLLTAYLLYALVRAERF